MVKEVINMTSYGPTVRLPESAKIVGVARFVTFLDENQKEYFVPIWNVPDSDELKEIVLRAKVNDLLKEANDDEMVQRILDVLGPCFV